ncbi:MAG: helix-turn-helix transcriptional regulator [Flavobacteriales bacterium]|nr:helix-turn-helix transcriptional regulator [Flavobacteriales bacterium]
MAPRLGVSQRQYSRYETGESSLAPEKLTVVCEVLEVEQEDLLNFDERLVFHHSIRPMRSVLGMPNTRAMWSWQKNSVLGSSIIRKRSRFCAAS